MWPKKKCPHGLSILESLNFSPTVDNLNIAFKDPFGFKSDLSKMQNRYAFQGSFRGMYDYQIGRNVDSILYIDGQDMGTLENPKIQAIKALAEPSLIHENVGKASEIKSNRINLDFDLSQEVEVMAPMGFKIIPKLHKLAIYEKDCLFSEHVDTQHGENHIGTLLVYLPVPYEGGAIILSDNANELRLPFDEMAKYKKFPWVAFYADVKHKVEVGNSGVRMILHYDLEAVKNNSNEEYNIEDRIQGRYFREPNNRYRFKGYNEEVLTALRDKLYTIFAQQKEKGVEKSKKDEETKGEDDEEEMEEEENEENEEEDEEEDYEDEDEENLDKKTLDVDGIAIMLKRGYEKPSSSLKGSDSVLYNSLKDHFTVELKQIILEQSSERGRYRDQPLEVIAISRLDELQESCSSEEELQLDQDNMRIPVKCSKKDKQNQGVKLTHEQKYGKKKRVFLVSGLCPQKIKKLVDRYGDENRDDDDSTYSYIHSALFIYPKN